MIPQSRPSYLQFHVPLDRRAGWYRALKAAPGGVRGTILELKQTSDENEDKVLTAMDAVEQIIRKKYADPYIKRNDIKAVISYGICFCKKECSVVGKKLKSL